MLIPFAEMVVEYNNLKSFHSVVATKFTVWSETVVVNVSPPIICSTVTDGFPESFVFNIKAFIPCLEIINPLANLYASVEATVMEKPLMFVGFGTLDSFNIC